MPSPFPGMDPFLELPFFLPGVHDSFITYLREALQAALPQPYFAEINERLWVDTVERPIGPDVDVLRGNQPSPPEQAGGVAVATAAPTQPIVITIRVEDRRETYLEIRTPSPDGERVVTTIEVLSLTNKTPGPRGAPSTSRNSRKSSTATSTSSRSTCCAAAPTRRPSPSTACARRRRRSITTSACTPSTASASSMSTPSRWRSDFPPSPFHSCRATAR